jgi:hypothetical protein
MTDNVSHEAARLDLGILCVVFGCLGIWRLAFLALFGGLAESASWRTRPGRLRRRPHPGRNQVVVSTFIGLLSLPGLVVGIGLTKFRRWARLGGVVLSALNLLNFPLGSALGAYGLWVLLSKESEPLFA